MKKLLTLLVYAALVLALLTSCSEPKNEAAPKSAETTEKATDDKDNGELNKDNTEQGKDTAPENNNATEDNKNATTENKEAAKETKIDSGRFNGLADANFFEVKISGVPDTIEPKVFMLTEEVRQKFENLQLKQDDEIKLYYYETPDGQLAVTDIEKISQ